MNGIVKDKKDDIIFTTEVAVSNPAQSCHSMSVEDINIAPAAEAATMNGIVKDIRDDISFTKKDASSNLAPLRSSMSAEDITNAALQFLSTASTEAIVGVVVALTTLTYFILGRVGLIFIGAFAGVLLHATWEIRFTQDHISLRGERSLDVIKRLLDQADQNTKSEIPSLKDNIVTYDFNTFKPETASALKELVDAVIRDYVKWWYQKLIPKDTTFILAVRQTLSHFILSITFHICKKRPEDIFLNFLTNSSSIIIVFLSELSAALTLSPGPAVEAVHSYLYTNPDSSLANALDEKYQKKKLKMTAADILQNFAEKSVHECSPVRVFLTEVLSCLILESALKTCSKPEWINGWIIFLLEKGESDLSQAIDAGIDKNQQDGIPGESAENLGHAGLAQQSTSNMQQEHQGSQICNRPSKAEEAMDKALEEAKRLSDLIAEEEAKKKNIPQTDSLIIPKDQPDDIIDLNTMKNTTQKELPPKSSNYVSTSIASKHMDAQNPNLSNYEKSKELSGTQEPSVPLDISHSTSSLAKFDPTRTDYPLGNRDSSPPIDRKVALMTLYNASVAIYDNSSNFDKGKMRSKPNYDFLIQIEPISCNHPGWMIVRRYSDFETLHEILRRIAQISGVTTFTEQHQNLPSWKESSKETLRIELERYIRNACLCQPLAESEGMKRFFKKDQEQQASGNRNGFPGIGWSTPSAMGKGMLDALASAPKGVAEGSKAITGVFNNIGNLGQKKSNGVQVEALSRNESVSYANSHQPSRTSEDSHNSSSMGQTQSNRSQILGQRVGYDLMAMDGNQQGPESSSPSTRSSISGHQSSDPDQDSTGHLSKRNSQNSSPVQFSLDTLVLPPPPTEMPDDYGSHSVNGLLVGCSRSGSNGTSVRTATSREGTPPRQGQNGLAHKRSNSSVTGHSHSGNNGTPVRTATTSTMGTPRQRQNISAHMRNKSSKSGTKSREGRNASKLLTEDETRVAVELIFAVINEIYTISSVWNIRRTLLTAAKSYFLRPGNPSLLQIQSLIQESVISANTSDASIAAYLKKLRQNCLPTEEELKVWPTEMSSEHKERLRIRARKLLIKRGVPTALTGVMGQAATSEAMGHIFDCLQIEEVTRGLIFGVLLQGIRAVLY